METRQHDTHSADTSGSDPDQDLTLAGLGLGLDDHFDVVLLVVGTRDVLFGPSNLSLLEDTELGGGEDLGGVVLGLVVGAHGDVGV